MTIRGVELLARIADALERQAAATERLADIAASAPGVVRIAGVGKPPTSRRARRTPNAEEASELDRARARRELRRLGLVKP